jgi:hypothetical protein
MEAVGANVKGYIVLEDSVESECTHVSTATSSTISTLPPVDDDGEDESAGCAVDLDGPNQQVVVNAIVPIVDEHGNLLFNVSTCGDVDPVDPFGEFYSAYYQCDQFGFQIHANVTTVLGTPTAAHTLTGGSFLYNTGMPPSGSGPTEVICKFASWDNPEAAVKTGEVVIFYPPGPPAKLTDEELRALYGEPATDLLNPSAAMVGSYNGELHFVPRPGSPSDVGYSSDFIVTIIAESDGTYSIRLEQRPSGQISTGKFLGQTTVFLASGTGAGHSETYFGGVRRGPDGQLEFVGTTWGGSASLSFDSQATILALASAEVGDGVINLENSASVYSGFGTAQEPLEERSREELEEVAQQMQNPDADLESVGPIGWLLTVVGQLFASEG